MEKGVSVPQDLKAFQVLSSFTQRPGDGLRRLVVVQSLVYHGAGEAISPIPPALWHIELAVHEVRAFRVQDRWGVPVVLLLLPIALPLYIDVLREEACDQAGHTDLFLGHLLRRWSKGVDLWLSDLP